jgi:hypothetical protein
VATATVLLLASACGGDDDVDRLSEEEYTSGATEACEEALAAVDERIAAADPQFTTFDEAEIVVFQAQSAYDQLNTKVDVIQRLEPPEDLEREAVAFLADLQALEDAVRHHQDAVTNVLQGLTNDGEAPAVANLVAGADDARTEVADAVEAVDCQRPAG